MSLFSILMNRKLLRANLLLVLKFKFSDAISVLSYLVYLGQLFLYLYTFSTGKSGNSARKSGAKVSDIVVSKINADTGTLCSSLINMRNAIIHWDSLHFTAAALTVQSLLDSNMYPIPKRLQHLVYLLKLIDLETVSVYWTDLKMPESIDEFVFVDRYYKLIPDYYKQDNDHLDRGAVVLNYFKSKPNLLKGVL